MKRQAKISVIVLTYNHEKYIKRALDSILNQKTDYSYEILIGDDCSTDNSWNILKEYKKKYPDIIRIFQTKKNMGATRNLYHLLKKASGEYIAQLETDDYWSDELKLQKQIDFLEKNREYVGCSHHCTVVDQKENPIERFNNAQKETYWNFCSAKFTLKDCEMGKYPGHFGTMVYRNIFLENRQDYRVIYRAHGMIGDRTIICLLSLAGDIYVLNDNMSCYRMIESNKAENWQSQARQKNKRYEEFHYICELEKYMNVHCERAVSMKTVRQEKIVCASVYMLDHFNCENFKVVLQMCLDNKSTIGAFVLACSSIFQKMFYRFICGEDRPVVY